MKTPSRLAGLRVIIVEDETMIAMMLSDILTDLGCIVVGMASRLPKAFELIEAGDADLAIVDLNLNGVSSIPAAEAAAVRGLSIIFVTGYGNADVTPHLKIWPVIAKPYTPEELERGILAALAKTV